MDHITNEEIQLQSGSERLDDIVTEIALCLAGQDDIQKLGLNSDMVEQAAADGILLRKLMAKEAQCTGRTEIN